VAPAVSDSGSKRSLWLTGAATAVVAGLGGGVTYVALAPSATERIQTAVPALPDLADAVPTLRQKLQDAHQQVGTTGDLAALADYARLLHANGFATEAIQTWRLLMREDPADGRWPNYLAHLYRDAGDMGETTLLLQQTTGLAPNYSPAWLQLGDLALKTGGFAHARSYYERRLLLEPGDPYARLGLARIDLQKGRTSDAKTALRDLVADHASFASAHNLLSRLYRDAGQEDLAENHRWLGYQSGRFATAEDPWLRELHDWCFNPQLLFVIGMVDFQTGRGDRGRTEYERAVEVEPQNPGNHELLGDYYRKLNEPELARSSLRQSISLAEFQGTTPPLLSFINLAAIQREQGNFESSRRIAEAGIKAHPRSPELRVELGLTSEALNDFTQAVEAYEAALSLSPHDTAAHFHLGELQLRGDQIDEAMASFEAALVQQPTFALALRNLIQHALVTNRPKSAAGYAETLLKAYWGDSEVRQLVAIYHLRRGRAELAAGATQTAISQFEQGFKLAPQDVDLAYELGTLQLARGNPQAAVSPLEVLLELRPADPSAHFFLAQAYLMEGRVRRAVTLLEDGLKLAEDMDQTQTAANIREMLQAVRR
jgi:tetratricopeptide (TPR) repeat protein